ncbi:hypothetical protein SEA_MASHLEY_67 [Microbacterium phage Mashley]|nr:hypothetical protein SEA_MASHLEY_67 [Microbacterium phage Mashley]
MSAIEDAIALLRSRVEHHRIGRSTWRETDHDIIAMRKAIELLEPPAAEVEGEHARLCGCDLPRCEFIEGWEAAWSSALRSTLRLGEGDLAPLTEEQRIAFAEWLDDFHGNYVTEGGCDFHPWRYQSITFGTPPGPAGHIVDPILERARQ